MSANDTAQVVNAGADALMVHLGEGISLSANQRVITLQRALAESDLPIVDMVPAYSSLMVYYNVCQINEQQMRAQLAPVLDTVYQEPMKRSSNPRVHTIDVYYGEEVGPDLRRVAEHRKQSLADVVKQHTKQSFRVYALGFAPGFAYMGILPDTLAVPRLDRPREKIAAGSVAIAEQQTAVYPLASPGGWNIIGRTAQPLYQPERGVISHLEVGDEVQFNAISREQFVEVGGNLEPLDD